MHTLLREQISNRDDTIIRLTREAKHLRDGLELILCMETPVANGTTKKIMRAAEQALNGQQFDV